MKVTFPFRWDLNPDGRRRCGRRWSGSRLQRLALGMLVTFSAHGVLTGENAAWRHKGHFEDWTRCQIWVSSFNWSQIKRLSRETLGEDDGLVKSSPGSCKLNTRTSTLEPLMGLCERGCWGWGQLLCSKKKKVSFPITALFLLQPFQPHS